MIPPYLFLCSIFMLLLGPGPVFAIADLLPDRRASSADSILDPEQAFRASAWLEAGNSVRLHWDIEPGYYLYRENFRLWIAGQTLTPDNAALPAGTQKYDEVFGDVEVYYQTAEFAVPVDAGLATQRPLTVEVQYQGCKENTVCYPPVRRRFALLDGEIALGEAVDPGSFTAAPGPNGVGGVDRVPAQPLESRLDSLMRQLVSGPGLGTLLAFFGFGLLLSLTPCVYPMIPILAGTLVRHDETVNTGRTFLLSVCFVLAMALSYSLLGVFAGLSGVNLQAAAQQTWVIVGFSLVFIVLALSMFGLFTLQMPSFIQRRLHNASERQQRGSLQGAAAMGALSALIVGPCVTPPLAAALLYISRTGDATLGGSALFMMGLGFGVPLLILGTSAGRLLPRVGRWMNTVKHGLGVLLLAVAVWLLERVLPSPLSALLWACLLLVSALFLGALERLERPGPGQRIGKGLGMVMLVYGAIMVVGAATGGGTLSDPLHELKRQLRQSGQLQAGAEGQAARPSGFLAVRSIAELEHYLAMAHEQGRPVVLDFYADWCIDCHRLARESFADPRARALLAKTMALQADVTENNSQDRALLQRFSLFGPPGLAFYDRDGQFLPSHTLVGFVEPDAFVAHLETLFPR